MTHDRNPNLQRALICVGVALLFVYPVVEFWPFGQTPPPGRDEYGPMIAGTYATLGFFLLRASLKPEAHSSLIWFTVWSSIVRGCVLAVRVIAQPTAPEHLLGDVVALLLVAIVLAALAPPASSQGLLIPLPRRSSRGGVIVRNRDAA